MTPVTKHYRQKILLYNLVFELLYSVREQAIEEKSRKIRWNTGNSFTWVNLLVVITKLFTNLRYASFMLIFSLISYIVYLHLFFLHVSGLCCIHLKMSYNCTSMSLQGIVPLFENLTMRSCCTAVLNQTPKSDILLQKTPC